MRLRTIAPALAASAFLVACGGGGDTANTSQQKAGATPAAAASNRNAAGRPDIGVVSSHGGPSSASSSPGAPSGPGGGGGGSVAPRPEVATPELDAKIEKAEAKAKAPGATEADRKAAGAAYFERANFFFNAGNPRLYRFSLADYRRGLRYNPDDAQARANMNEIVRIYRSMNMPVPELGNEP